MPDRFIADGVCVGRIDLEGDQSQCAAAFLLFGGRTADEPVLLEIDESIEASFEGPIDGAKFARPAAEALFDPHGIERSPAEQLQPVLAAGLDQLIVERALIVGGDPDLEAVVAGEGHPPHVARNHADFHAPEGHEGKAAVDKSSRTRLCNNAREFGPAIDSPTYSIAHGRTETPEAGMWRSNHRM